MDQRQVYPVRGVVWIKDYCSSDEWTLFSIAIHNGYSPVVCFLSSISFRWCEAGVIGRNRIIGRREGGKLRDLKPVPGGTVYGRPDKGWRAGKGCTGGRADQAGQRILFDESLGGAVIPQLSFAINHGYAPVILAVVVPFCRRPAALFCVNTFKNGRECGIFTDLEAVFPRSKNRVTCGFQNQRRPT